MRMRMRLGRFRRGKNDGMSNPVVVRLSASSVVRLHALSCLEVRWDILLATAIFDVKCQQVFRASILWFKV